MALRLHAHGIMTLKFRMAMMVVFCATACAAPIDDPPDDVAARVSDDDDIASCLRETPLPVPPLPTLTFPTPHFQIEYRPAGDPQAPIPDCVTETLGARIAQLLTCYPFPGTDPAVPDVIEDMGRMLEEAYAQYQQRGYDVAPSGRQMVDVRLLPPNVAGAFQDGLILIDSRLRGEHGSYPSNLWLRTTTAHELFHAVQRRAYVGTLSNPDLTGYFSHRWLREATATAMALELAPAPDRFYLDNVDHAMAQLPLNPVPPQHIGDPAGYESFAWFRYVKSAHGLDLPSLLFNRTDPKFAQAKVPRSGSTLALINTLLAADRPDRAERLELWKRFSFALHYARSNLYIPDAQALFGPVPPRSEEADAAPSGYEREVPDPEIDEEPPLLQNALVVDAPDPDLTLGHAFSYKIDLRRVLCETPGAPIPDTEYTCIGTQAIPDRSTARLVLRIVRPAAAAITVYRMPLSTPGSNRADTAPEVLVSDLIGSTPQDVEVPLSRFRYLDEAVVSIVYDPEAEDVVGPPLELEAYFRTGCDGETVVRCDYADGCHLRDITVPRNCRKIQIWAWGGGGPAMFDGLHRASATGGGGGFAFLKVKNDHPVFHVLRLQPAHSGGNAASTVNWMSASAWGPMTVVAAGGGGASFGYERDWGMGNYRLVYARGGAGDQPGEDDEYATGARPGTASLPGAGGIALITEVSTASNGRDGGAPSIPTDGGYRVPGSGGVGLVNGVAAWNGNGGAGYFGGGAGGFGRRGQKTDSQGGSGGGGGHSFAGGLGATVLEQRTGPGNWEQPGEATSSLRCANNGCITGYGGIGEAGPGGGGIVVVYK